MGFNSGFKGLIIKNDVTNDTMFDEHKRDTVCVRLSVSFFSKPSERIPVC